MKTVSSLYRNERQREFSRCLSIARQTEENAANIAEETALVVAVPSDGTETDVWAEDSAKEEKEEDIFHSSHLHEHGAEDEDIVAEQEQGTETNKEEELNDTLKDFLDCIKQVKGTVTEDVQAVSRELAKHSVGVTSAKSFAELQHHVNEIVQLSGPELGCAWSTVKVGVGVASVLSGNLLVGSFMVALAAGSLGTSLIWKAHRDSKRSQEASKKEEENAEINVKTTEEGTATKRCVSFSRERDNPGVQHQAFSRQNTVKKVLMQVSQCGKDNQDDSKHSEAANTENLIEYDAWSGEG